MRYENDQYIKFIKVDKNGTEIYHDSRCHRCGGSGNIDHYRHVDGGVCFECYGTGLANKAHVIKHYTPEYAAKLEVQQKKRQLAKINVEEINNRISRNLGFKDTDTLYVYVGDTFSYKDTLKSGGAYFKNLSGATPTWISTKDLGDFPKVYKLALNKEDIPKVVGELGLGQYQDLYDIACIEKVTSFLNEFYWKAKYEKIRESVDKPTNNRRYQRWS